MHCSWPTLHTTDSTFALHSIGHRSPLDCATRIPSQTAESAVCPWAASYILAGCHAGPAHSGLGTSPSHRPCCPLHWLFLRTFSLIGSLIPFLFCIQVNVFLIPLFAWLSTLPPPLPCVTGLLKVQAFLYLNSNSESITDHPHRASFLELKPRYFRLFSDLKSILTTIF